MLQHEYKIGNIVDYNNEEMQNLIYELIKKKI